jgi:tRNA threonylcarbamoyladenosine biosynthesis protein TsaB
MSQNPLILAVETSSRVGSVAIATGEKILKELIFSGQMRHSAEIFPAILTLLQFIGRKPHNIDHIYISNGPGSFTGLRIAATFAKTMHLANRTKVIAVDTLDVIASNMVD